MTSFKISTGIKSYDIEDENGNIRGQIHINTTDFNMFKRAKKGQEEINNLVSEISLIEGNNTDEILEATEKADKTIKSIINDIFDDENVSDVVFGKQSCLNVVDSKTFVERFLNVVMPVVYKDLEEGMKKADANIEKYVSQVSK